MPQILRHHTGTAAVDARLLADVDWVLDMDSAAPPGQVAPVAARVQACLAAGEDPERDPTLAAAGRAEWHDYLRLLDVHAVQRLRGWHRSRHGQVTVDAGRLAEVRNVLDGETFARLGCEDFLSGGGWPDGDPERAAVAAAVAAGDMCYRCGRCQAVVMRDRIDAALDAAGHTGRSAWLDLGYDPEACWRERVAP